MYLLDTNIIIGILRGKQEIIKKYQKISDKKTPIFLTTYSVSEIYIGFFDEKFKKEDPVKLKIQQELLERMITKLQIQERVLSLEINDAKVFGELLYLLRVKGMPIPIIDALVGSIAISKNLIVITTDENHFKAIKSVQKKLKVEFWIQ